MLATRIQIRHRNRSRLGDLTLDAGGALDCVWCPKVRRNPVDRRRRCGRQRTRNVLEELRVRYYGALLRGPIEQVRALHQVVSESVIENSESATQHRFRSGLAITADTPRHAYTRSKVCMIVNIVL